MTYETNNAKSSNVYDGISPTGKNSVLTRSPDFSVNNSVLLFFSTVGGCAVVFVAKINDIISNRLFILKRATTITTPIFFGNNTSLISLRATTYFFSNL